MRSASACDCITEVDELLAKSGERLATAFDVKGNVFLVVGVRKKLGKGKTTLLLPSYCPFCGKKQPERSAK